MVTLKFEESGKFPYIISCIHNFTVNLSKSLMTTDW